MRVPQKRGQRGSQKWLQLAVNRAPHLLDRALAGPLNLSGTDKITWLSPLENDGYAEYRDEAFLARLKIQPQHEALDTFWPARGPQWDGLGRTSRGEALLLEAKAHIPELLSTPTGAKGQGSRRLIAQSLARVKAGCGSRSATDWSGLCYQYTNRLAHLYFVRNLNRIPAYLVFVYFLNATDMGGPATAEEWVGAIRFLHAMFGIDERRLDKVFGHGIIDVFVDVKDIEVASEVRTG
jgi:hypothetical protein